jgi:hypothetical protein
LHAAADTAAKAQRSSLQQRQRRQHQFRVHTSPASVHSVPERANTAVRADSKRPQACAQKCAPLRAAGVESRACQRSNA